MIEVLHLSKIPNNKVLKYLESVTSRYTMGNYAIVIDGEIDSLWEYESAAKEFVKYMRK